MAIIPKGKEPANVKKRIDTLFPKLDGAYPDKVIVSLQRDHKKWDETAREISRQLGYENKNDFLISYGYKIEKAETGRPKATEESEIIEELKKRYPDGSPFQKVPELAEANPDLAGKLKTLANHSSSLFGMSFGKYLKSIGLLGATKYKAQHKSQLEELIAELKKRYPEGAELPKSISQLKTDNADLMMYQLNYINEVYSSDPKDYLLKEGFIKKSDPEAEFQNLINELKARYANKKMPRLVSELKKENSDLPLSAVDNWLRENKGVTLGRYLISIGLVVSVQEKKPLPEDGIDFTGRVFVATALEEWEKKKIEKEVLRRGGIIRTSVSKNTDYLIINPNMQYPSPKYLTAKEWIAKGVNIKIFTYKEFFEKVRLHGNEDLITEDFLIKNGVLKKYFGKKSEVLIPNNVVEIEKRAFKECDHIVSVSIPSSVKTIGSNAFQYCSNLETVTFHGENLQSIGNSAFYGCIKLKEITLPNSVTEIGEWIFVGCASLRSVKLSESLRRIPYRAFRFFVGLDEVFCCPFTEIVIPNSVTEIDEGAFEGCKSLASITIPESVKKIDGSAFNGCTVLTIHAPAGSYAEEYARKNIPLVLWGDETSNCKKDLFGSSSYSYRLRTKSKEALLACLSYIAYGEGGDSFDPEKGIYDAEVEIYEQEDEYIAEIAYKTEIYMDLPNFFDDGAECMYTYCKEMVEETGACPFKFSFHMSERHGIYFHVGDCTFDGKTISYFDNASVNCIEPSDSSAMAEYINGEFANEEKNFNTEIPD